MYKIMRRIWCDRPEARPRMVDVLGELRTQQVTCDGIRVEELLDLIYLPDMLHHTQRMALKVWVWYPLTPPTGAPLPTR